VRHSSDDSSRCDFCDRKNHAEMCLFLAHRPNGRQLTNREESAPKRHSFILTERGVDTSTGS
jgi:hypothetical protein